MERCCGSCIYHEHEDDVDYRCVCADSDKCDKYTMSRDCCDHWQGWYYTGKIKTRKERWKREYGAINT